MGNICSKKSSENENEGIDDKKRKDNYKLSSSNNQMGKKENGDNQYSNPEEDLKIKKITQTNENQSIQNSCKKNKNLKIKEEKMNYENNIIKENQNEEVLVNSSILFNENGNKDEKEKEKDISQNYNTSFIEKQNHKYNISLGINIGASKTVYSIFSKINNKYVSNVLLMNNTSRIIPSIICYTKDHRLFGDNSISSLKQNLNTSYNNLSRLIGFDNNIKFYQNEIQSQFVNYKDMKLFQFYSQNSFSKNEIKSENVLYDFLSLINSYYFIKDSYSFSYTFISVPDFYTSYQREILTLICKTRKMKEIKILNESSAITMYYGYTKYRDNFVIEKNKVDPTIEKNILFIDIGYSKTSFILSNFKYNEFRVEYVLCDPYIGGRNFDELIYNYCINEFKKKKN